MLINQIAMKGYRYGLHLITPPVTELQANDSVAKFYTRNVGETHEIRRPGRKELPVVKMFLDDLETGDIVYDIGANLGLYSVFSGVAEDVEILAFEPVDSIVERLRENLELNGVSAAVHQIAVGDSDGEVTLSSSSAQSLGTATVVDETNRQSQRVTQRAIDGLVREGVSPPDVLKIDVEGYELAVLKGMKNVFADHSPRLLYVELHESGSDGVRAMLEKQGYETEIVFERGAEKHLKAKRRC